MNFHETQPPDIKRTTATNISKNSNRTSQVAATKMNNFVFDIKPVSSSHLNVHVPKPEKERFVKKVSQQKFVPPLPPVLPPNTMQVPFPALRTKYTEVVFESNLRDSDQSQIVYFPIDKVAPIVENIITAKGYIEKHVEEYFIANKISMEEISKHITLPLDERIQHYLDSLEIQNTVQKKELIEFIETLVQEKFDSEKECTVSKEDTTEVKEYMTKTEAIELMDASTKTNYSVIQRDVNNLKTKTTDFYTSIQSEVKELKTGVVEWIEQKSKTNLKAIHSEVNELKTEVIEFIEEKCITNLETLHSDVNELKTKESMTKTEVNELIEEKCKASLEAILSEVNELKATNAEVRELVEETCKAHLETIQSEVNELKTKESMTKKEVIQCIDTAIQSKEFVTKSEVIKCIEERKAFIISEVLELNPKEYVTKSEMNEKIYALNMEFLVEKYVTQMIEKGEDDENHNMEENDDEPKTRFEEIIQPSVARIIHRVAKYDQTQPMLNNNVSVNFEVDDVYDMKRQEKDHFTDCEAKGNSIYNPMYSDEPTVYKGLDIDDEIVEMGSVYKGEECSGTFLFENELRKVGVDRRWNRFGNGIETGSVIDLFLDKNNRKIYIVGNFKFVNRVPLENIAVYDLNERKWKHVGEGIPQVATAIAVDEENEIVYVGGVFSKVGKGDCEVKANNVAAYHVKENKWYALGEGLNRDCSSILFDKVNKKLYAGGSFTQSGSKILKYVAMYDIEINEWQSLKGGSVNGPCRMVLKPTEDDLYLGGLFTHAGNEDIHVSYVARYHLKTDSWHSLGGGLQGYCNAITYDSTKNKLYVGGTFTSVGSIDAAINANHIAEYDIDNNLWNDMDGGLNNIVQSIFYDANNECVYVGGTFTHSFENNIQLNHIARYDLKESKWHCLENHYPTKKTPHEDDGNDNVGLNGNCKVLSVDNKSLFIAGSFQIAGNITANSIVRYSLNTK